MLKGDQSNVTLDAKILSFDEVKAHGASAPRTVSPSSSSRRAYDRYSAALGEQDFGTPAFLPNRQVSTSQVQAGAQRGNRNQFVGATRGSSQHGSRLGKSSRSSFDEGISAGEAYYSGEAGYFAGNGGHGGSRFGNGSASQRSSRAAGNSSRYASGRSAAGSARSGRSRYASEGSFEGGARNRSGYGYYNEQEELRSQRYDNAYDAEEAPQRHAKNSEESLIGSLKKKFRSAKADRQFDRTVGARERAEAQRRQQGEASRAAVYDMRMGATQRRSSRMAEESKKKGPSLSLPFGIPLAIPAHVPQWAMRIAAGAAVFALAAVVLFPGCQNYYNETRQLQQLQAEYDALESYNAKMQTQVDYLNTDEGLEDYARSELGWVRSDEKVVNVEGVTSTGNGRNTERLYAITSGSIKAPDTWYSGVLDVIFGYGSN